MVAFGIEQWFAIEGHGRSDGMTEEQPCNRKTDCPYIIDRPWLRPSDPIITGEECIDNMVPGCILRSRCPRSGDHCDCSDVRPFTEALDLFFEYADTEHVCDIYSSFTREDLMVFVTDLSVFLRKALLDEGGRCVDLPVCTVEDFIETFKPCPYRIHHP